MPVEADSQPGFTDEPAMPDIVLEVMAQAVDFEIIAPDPLGWRRCQSAHRLGRLDCLTGRIGPRRQAAAIIAAARLRRDQGAMVGWSPPFRRPEETWRAYFPITPETIARRRVFDLLQAGGQFLLRHVDVQPTFHDVERDDIPVFTAAIGPPSDGLRGDMSGHQTVRGTGESSVGEQRDGIANPAPTIAAVTPSISRMPGPGWSFVSNDDDITCFDLPGLHGL